MTNPIRGWLAIVLLCALTAVKSNCVAQDSNGQNTVVDDQATGQRPADFALLNPFPNATTIKPSLFGDRTEWVNTDQSIRFADLKGKVVVLNFWTYSSVHCMHVLPDLKYLEQKYGDQLVVIGVHSAKFKNEKDGQQIQQAIGRYEIDHPVVNDHERVLWKQFGIRSWPTLVLIDPEGRLVGSQPGEGNRALFDRLIFQMVKYHRQKGTLNEASVRFQKSVVAPNPKALHYPGKVFVDEDSKRIFISDSSHHRLVVCDLDGKFQMTIGAGSQGFQDGDLETVQFNRPQGMALVKKRLYVADTDNHAIRVVDLEANTVTTLVGTGVQADYGAVGGSLDQAKLNSPWDLVVSSEQMYIAMAGCHQIWSHEMGSDQVSVFAGNGAEDVVNGSRQAAAFAQPSDLSVSQDAAYLFVADSAGSAIRRIDLSSGFVTTIAGTSGLARRQSLFEFGDVDAVGSDIRLQHPLAVTVVSGGLLVADSYNHKIKSISLPSLQASTWFGREPVPATFNPPALAEPADITATDQFAYLADTNHHRILKVDLKTQTAIQLPIEILAEKAEVAIDDGQADSERVESTDLEADTDSNEEDKTETKP